MQAVSELYRAIASGRHWKEFRAVIGGVAYGMDAIVSLSTHRALYAENRPMVGSCVAGEIDISFFPGGSVPPRMAEIRLLGRVCSDTQVSEWLPKGVYFFDTRTVDPETGLYTVHGYDAMLKGEQTFLGQTESGSWPRDAATLANQIAARMGVTIDSRTVLDPSVLIPYPLDYTCRELLCQIAVAHAGNWIMTDAGELRLVGLAEIPEETNLLVNEDGYVIKFGEVAIVVG